MATKRMTAKDYKRELKDLQKQEKALEARIRERANELIKENLDVVLHLSCHVMSHPLKEIEEVNDIQISLEIIEGVEKYLADKHPHKQTTIKF